MTVPGGSPLLISMTDSPDGQVNDIYVSYNRLPTTYQADFKSLGAGANPTLGVPATVGGTYYVLVHNRSGAPGTFNLSATLPGLTLLQAAPQTFGNAGQATLTVDGLGLKPDTVFSLVGPSGTITAATTRTVSSALAYVTFNLTGVLAGSYDLHAANADSTTDVLPGAVTVINGNGGLVVATVVGSSPVRAGRTGVFYVQYANVGKNDALAPLLTVTSPQLIPMSLDPAQIPTAVSLQVLGINQATSSAVLSPGAAFRVPVYYRAPASGTFEFEVVVTNSTETTALDEDSWQDILRGITADVKGAANWPVVEAQLYRCDCATRAGKLR